MVFVTEAFASWLFGQIADEGRKRLTTWVLGSDQERALRRAAATAVRRTAEELWPDDNEQAEHVVMVIDEVFREPMPRSPTAGHATLVQAIQAGIAGQLAPLGDAELTDTGQSSAQVLQISAMVLTEKLTSHLLREIIIGGAGGGPLAPLASQLNHDVTHLQGRRAEDKVDWLTGVVLEALARLESGLPITAPAAAIHMLPADIASFTGREAQLDQLKAALPSGDDEGGAVRIDAVDGMAGVGKTAFAVHAAHQVASRFPDGQLFLRLHGHTPDERPVEPADALATLLLADGVAPRQIPPGAAARELSWRDRTAGRKMLLVLDDATDSKQVRPLLPGTAGTLVLVTSRRRLTALPGALRVTLDILEADQAAQLFVQLAERAGLLPGDEAVANVTRLCGYLPLAISMMAGQLKHHAAWTAADLTAELKLATDRPSIMSAENNSVAASFGLSYRNLPEDRQRLFRRLGLHPGTDVDAFAAAALNGTDLATTRKLMDDLFGYHLIEEPARSRYRFHDLIREHARTLAAADEPSERDAATGRLLDYYLRTARAADRHLARRTPAGAAEADLPPACAPDLATREDAVAWMDAERINLRAAAGYAATNDWPGHAIAIPAAMQGFLRTQGHWDQALTLHHMALNTARHASDPLAEAGALTDLGGMQQLTGSYPAAVASFTQALELYRDLGSRLGEASALDGLGAVQYLTTDYRAATASFTRAVALFGDIGDRLGEAGGFHRLGVVQRLTANYRAADASQAQALKLYRALGDQAGEASVLNELGVVQHLTGDYPAAAASQTQALERYRALGNRLGEANTLTDLGIVQHLTGDYPAAAASQTQALERYRALGNRLGEANTLDNLGIVQCVTGDYPAAAASLAEALDICRDLDDSLGEANVLTDLGTLQTLTGDYPSAAANLAKALDLCRGIRSRIAEANARNGLGVVQTLTGDYPAATASLTGALNLYHDADNRIGEAGVLNNMGELALAHAAPAEACARHTQALAIATSLGSPLEEARALEGKGRCRLQDGQASEGALLLRQALAIYQRIGSPYALRVEVILRVHGV